MGKIGYLRRHLRRVLSKCFKFWYFLLEFCYPVYKFGWNCIFFCCCLNCIFKYINRFIIIKPLKHLNYINLTTQICRSNNLSSNYKHCETWLPLVVNSEPVNDANWLITPNLWMMQIGSLWSTSSKDSRCVCVQMIHNTWHMNKMSHVDHEEALCWIGSNGYSLYLARKNGIGACQRRPGQSKPVTKLRTRKSQRRPGQPKIVTKFKTLHHAV